MAVHAGHLYPDAHDVTGTTVNHLFQLLDAPAFKAAANGADLALIVSGHPYAEVIAHGSGLLGPGQFAPPALSCKETRTTGWVWQPAGPRPDAPAGGPPTSPATAPARIGRVSSAACVQTGRRNSRCSGTWEPVLSQLS